MAKKRHSQHEIIDCACVQCRGADEGNAMEVFIDPLGQVGVGLYVKHVGKHNGVSLDPKRSRRLAKLLSDYAEGHNEGAT